MNLLTYNVHYWEGSDGVTDVERVIEVIAASRADIIGLNEVFHPHLTAALGQPALVYMAERLGMHFAFGQAQAFSLAFHRPAQGFGNALLCRWPILAAAAHHLPAPAGHSPRGLLEARVLLPGAEQTLTLYVTHLDPRSEAVRLAQTQALLTWTARDRARPHVLMGDLNSYSTADWCGYDSEAALQAAVAAQGWDALYPAQVLPRLDKAGYTDAWILAGAGQAATYETPDARFRIDYILLSRPLVPYLRLCRRIDAAPAALASDHYPLAATLDL